MEKLSKKRAAAAAGISVYRLNKDIDNGFLDMHPAGGVCYLSLSRRYACSGPVLEPETESSPALVSPNNNTAFPAMSGGASSSLRLIGKLEALLSLAEKHRVMIEQQRRNIAMLKTLNARQAREIQHLRHELGSQEHGAPVDLHFWRRLLDRLSGPHRT